MLLSHIAGVLQWIKTILFISENYLKLFHQF